MELCVDKVFFLTEILRKEQSHVLKQFFLCLNVCLFDRFYLSHFKIEDKLIKFRDKSLEVFSNLSISSMNTSLV